MMLLLILEIIVINIFFVLIMHAFFERFVVDRKW